MSYNTVRKLPPEIVIKDEIFQELRQHNYFKICFHSILNIAVYVAVGILSIKLNIWWLYPGFWLVQGFLLLCFFDIAHECIHNNFAQTSKINRIAGIFWLLPVLVNFSLFQHYHLEHHKNTNVEGDPEPSATLSSFRRYALTFIFVFFYSPLKMSVDAAFGKLPPYVSSEKVRRDIQANTVALLLWLICIITYTFFFWRYAVLMYWMPLIFVYPIAFTTVTLEHYGCDRGTCLLSNTRTISSNFLFRCLVWNGNYHAEHHAYPSVPAHNLPRLHSLIGKHFKYQESSYILFHLKLIRSLLQQTP